MKMIKTIALCFMLCSAATADENTAPHVFVGGLLGFGSAMGCYAFTGSHYKHGCAVFGASFTTGMIFLKEAMDSQERRLPLDWGDVGNGAAGLAGGLLFYYLVAPPERGAEQSLSLQPAGPFGSSGATVTWRF